MRRCSCTAQLSNLIGNKLAMTLTGVTDLAGNAISAPLTWSFVMQNFQAMQTSVQLSGIQLNIPFSYNLTIPGNPLLANVTATVAQFLQISPSRLQNFMFSAGPSGTTLVSVTVLSPSTSGSRRAPNDGLSVEQLLSMLEQGIMDGTLNLPVSNETVV